VHLVCFKLRKISIPKIDVNNNGPMYNNTMMDTNTNSKRSLINQNDYIWMNVAVNKIIKTLIKLYRSIRQYK